MLDNDNLTYSYQKRPTVNKSSVRALITLERSQKLDLLIHLLTNLQQSLVICGPKGIGKTTLLQTLQETRSDIWHFCRQTGSSSISFETIIQQLSRSLNLNGSGLEFDLSVLRAFCDKQKVVLIIDDAGELLPGLINELNTFAESLNGLRLVFAMSYDEFHIKSNADRALDECHVIELPPLNRKQTLEFLQNLSAQPSAALAYNAITDDLVDAIYDETHGIPGRLFNEMLKLDQYQGRQMKWGLWFGGIVVLAGTGFAAISLWPGGTFMNPSATLLPTTVASNPVELISNESNSVISVKGTQDINATMPTPVTETKALPIQPSPEPLFTAPDETASSTQPGPTATVPVDSATPERTAETIARSDPTISTPLDITAQTPAIVKTPADSATTPKPTDVSVQPLSKSIDVLGPVAEVRAGKKTITKPEPIVEKKPTENKLVDNKASMVNPSTSDQEWIQAQPGNRYTLQVMTLSSQDAVHRFMKKYADYGDALKYYTVRKNDQEKYILIYGSFESMTEARQYKEVMPGEFKRALEKRFKAVQQESRR